MVVFFAGLFIGALLNVIIIRLPREKRLFGWPRCTQTGKPLALWQMVPVLGWVLQKGQAGGRPIHWIYPFVELCTASTLALLYHQYISDSLLLFSYLSFVCIVLIVTGAIDWTHRYIYTFVILGATLLVMLLNGLTTMHGIGLLNSFLGMIISGTVFIFLFFLGKILFPSTAVPFGLGDVFLGLFIGAAFGLTRLLSTLFSGMLIAGVVAFCIVFAKYALKRHDTPQYMSYGSYLCFGAIVYLLVKGW